MENNERQVALNRLEQFQAECRQRDIPAFPSKDYTRLKTFFLNDLCKKYGMEIIDISFDELLSDFMGSGINTIEQYIQSLDPFWGEEPVEEAVTPEPSELDDNPVDEQEEITDGEQDNSSNLTGGDARQERRTKKKNNVSNGIFWTPPSSAKGNSKKIKELTYKINELIKNRDIVHRQLSFYRPDLAILQGLLEYGKKGSTPLEYNGLPLDNHQNVLHAALEILIKHLDSSGNTECFQNIKKFRDMAEDEAGLYNEKISKLEKELRKLSS